MRDAPRAHTCAGQTPRALFCVVCDHEVEPGSLKTLVARPRPSGQMEAFWETGDPDAFTRPRDWPATKIVASLPPS